MSNSLPVYGSRRASVTWGGVAFEGFSDDAIISMERNSDVTDEAVSADGKVATSMNPDRSGTITVSLLQTSPTNVLLSSLLFAQEEANTIYKANMVAEEDSGVIAVGNDAYIKTTPTVGLSKTQQTYEWAFFCDELRFLSLPKGLADDAAVLAAATSAIEVIKNATT